MTEEYNTSKDSRSKDSDSKNDCDVRDHCNVINCNVINENKDNKCHNPEDTLAKILLGAYITAWIALGVSSCYGKHKQLTREEQIQLKEDTYYYRVSRGRF